LGQPHLDRYQAIARRRCPLSARSPAPSGVSGCASPGLAPVTPSTQNQTSNTPPAEADPDREKLLYEAAFEQERLRDFEKAEMAFNAFVRRYPQSDYAGNAQYWLGEVYLAQSDLDNAGKAFAQVINQYPGHRKEADALYKLADVERRLGNRDKA